MTRQIQRNCCCVWKQSCDGYSNGINFNLCSARCQNPIDQTNKAHQHRFCNVWQYLPSLDLAFNRSFSVRVSLMFIVSCAISFWDSWSFCLCRQSLKFSNSQPGNFNMWWTVYPLLSILFARFGPTGSSVGEMHFNVLLVVFSGTLEPCTLKETFSSRKEVGKHNQWGFRTYTCFQLLLFGLLIFNHQICAYQWNRVSVPSWSTQVLNYCTVSQLQLWQVQKHIPNIPNRIAQQAEHQHREHILFHQVESKEIWKLSTFLTVSRPRTRNAAKLIFVTGKEESSVFVHAVQPRGRYWTHSHEKQRRDFTGQGCSFSWLGQDIVSRDKKARVTEEQDLPALRFKASTKPEEEETPGIVDEPPRRVRRPLAVVAPESKTKQEF